METIVALGTIALFIGFAVWKARSKKKRPPSEGGSTGGGGRTNPENMEER